MATRMGNNMYSLLAEEEPREEAPVQAAPKPVAAEKKKPVAAKAPVAAAPLVVKEAQKAEAPHHQRREDVHVREGKRVFERHSAPGRGRPAPKEGHNSWGKAGEEARETPAEETPATDAPATEEKTGEAAAAAEPVELDLATFLKKQAESRVVIALPAARRAGEGQEADPAWANAEELEHEEDEFYHGHKVGKKAAKKVAKKDEDVHVSLSSFLADSQAGQQLANRIERERRDRQRRERTVREEATGAPAPTTGAPAPAPRRNTRAAAPASRVAPPKVDDASFPSLAGKKAAPVAATAAPVAH